MADQIAKHTKDANAMARGVVNDVMTYRYGSFGMTWRPAAAFDVLDVSRAKMRGVESSVKALNDSIVARGADGREIAEIRADAKKNPGMARIPDATPDMPWHADRPALATYTTIANDATLDPQLRSAAAKAASAVGDLVLAHAESTHFAPFDGSSYADAAGPTVHFPVNAKQVDPWAPRISETHNRFFNETDAAAAERVIA